MTAHLMLSHHFVFLTSGLPTFKHILWLRHTVPAHRALLMTAQTNTNRTSNPCASFSSTTPPPSNRFRAHPICSTTRLATWSPSGPHASWNQVKKPLPHTPLTTIRSSHSNSSHHRPALHMPMSPSTPHALRSLSMVRPTYAPYVRVPESISTKDPFVARKFASLATASETLTSMFTSPAATT